MSDLEGWLREQLAEAEADEAAARAQLDAAQDRLEELRVTLKWLKRAPGAKVEREENQAFSELSQPDAAAVVLRDAGKPMPLKAMVDGMIDRGFGYGKGAKQLSRSLRGALSRLVQEQDTFYRVRRGVYGLIEWKQDGTNEGTPSTDEAAEGA